MTIEDNKQELTWYELANKHLDMLKRLLDKTSEDKLKKEMMVGGLK